LSKALGIQRERQVRERLESEGWAVVRAAGSLGCIDLVAGKAGEITLAVEVKADSKKFGPFNNFGPDKRAGLIAFAYAAGWKPVLAWWPPHGELKWLPPSEWP
jgi:Holliday junction resolvase